MSSSDFIEVSIPDTAEPLLGYRVFRVRDDDSTLWSVSFGEPGYKKTRRDKMLTSQARDEDKHLPPGMWATKMKAECNLRRKHDDGVPDPACTCGIYATYDLEVIAGYIPRAPILTLVKGYGNVIVGDPDDYTIGGWRASDAEIAAIFAISEDFTVPRRQLKRVAKRYGVPIIEPWSADIKEYAAAVRSNTLQDLSIDREPGPE